jgi:cell volume regulation protein A
MMFVFALLIIVSLFSLKLANRLNLPILLVFLLAGLIAGSDVLNLIYFDDMLLTQQIANLALIFVIFYAGFGLRREAIKGIMAPSLILATAGVAGTALLIGLFVRLFLRFGWLESFLIGSIISSTDALAVVNAVRSAPIRSRVSNTLVFESAANDPAAIIMTVFFMGLLQAGDGGSIWIMVLKLVYQIAAGIGLGLGAGLAGRLMFKALKSESRGSYHILMIGVILLAFGSASLARANGIIAVFFCGIFLGNARFPFKKGVDSFLDGIASFANTGLFLLLGLLAFPRQLPQVLGKSVAIAFFTFLAARSLVTFMVTPFFKYKFRESLFIAFAGIKGAVPVVLATYPAAAALDDGHLIFNIVFVVVLVSLLFQGTLMKPVSRLLGLAEPKAPPPEHSFELLSVNECSVDIFEHKVGPGSRYAGKLLSELELPDTVSVTSVIRGSRIIIPRGRTRLAEGDTLYILATEEEYARLAQLETPPQGPVIPAGTEPAPAPEGQVDPDDGAPSQG